MRYQIEEDMDRYWTVYDTEPFCNFDRYRPRKFRRFVRRCASQDEATALAHELNAKHMEGIVERSILGKRLPEDDHYSTDP